MDVMNLYCTFKLDKTLIMQCVRQNTYLYPILYSVQNSLQQCVPEYMTYTTVAVYVRHNAHVFIT